MSTERIRSAVFAQTPEGHSEAVCSVSISPDGGTIVSGSDDKTIKIWRPRP